MKNIAFIGIGLMGFPMVKNLLKNGYNVSVFDKKLYKAKKLSKYGASVSKSLKDVIKKSEVIITMVTDDKSVMSIIDNTDFINNLRNNSIMIDMSSTKPITSKKAQKKLKKNGIDFLDAPVSGGTKGAEEASLAIMVGGDQKVFNKVKKIFKTMGNAKIVGSNGSGQVAKLANQIIVGVTIGAVAEAIHLCKISGTDPNKFIKAVGGGFADSNILRIHGKKMIKKNFAPGGTNLIQFKDMKNILETSKDFNLPISNLVKKMYESLIKDGHEDKDHSSLFIQIEELNKNK